MLIPTRCPICANFDAKELPRTTDGMLCNCPRCGEYAITGTAVAMWAAKNPTERQIANASGWIREHQSICIDSRNVDNLHSVLTPSVAERADRLLTEVSRRFPSVGEEFELHFRDPSLIAVTWSESQFELFYLLDAYLVTETGFLLKSGDDGHSLWGHISPKGFRHLQEIQHSRIASNIGFCAMWFDEKVKHVWTDAIEPAIREAGYDPKRIDSHEHNNRIDDEILAMLRRSKFIVSDFTGQRGGVYFEAGFALGLGLEVIWTCREDELKSIHFDNRQYAFVTWEPDKLDDFKRRLQNRIEATLGRGRA